MIGLPSLAVTIVPWLPLFLAIPAVLGVLALMMIALRFYQRRRHPNPEITRKLLHVGMGLVVLTFPWLFAASWPVIALAAVTIALLLAARILPALQSVGSLTKVPRVSLGDVYFPLSVAVLFTLSHEEPLLYCIPLLILSLADAVAALIGLSYGRLHYEAAEGDKTAEGSFAFFTVAFLTAHIPLLLLTNTGRAETLLIALILGIVVMLAEGVAWRGLDNIFIPLLAFFLLRIYLHLSVNELLFRLVTILLLFILVYLLRKRTALTHSALMGAVLFGYATCALAGWNWVLPPLTLFLLHLIAWPRSDRISNRYDIHILISILAPGLFWLFLYAHYDTSLLLFPFTTLFSAHLAIIALSWLPPRDWSRRTTRRRIVAILLGSALALLTLLTFTVNHFAAPSHSLPLSRQLVPFLLANLLAVTAASALFAITLPRLIDPEDGTYRHIHHVGSIYAFLASVVTLLLLLYAP